MKKRLTLLFTTATLAFTPSAVMSMDDIEVTETTKTRSSKKRTTVAEKDSPVDINGHDPQLNTHYNFVIDKEKFDTTFRYLKSTYGHMEYSSLEADVETAFLTYAHKLIADGRYNAIDSEIVNNVYNQFKKEEALKSAANLVVSLPNELHLKIASFIDSEKHLREYQNFVQIMEALDAGFSGQNVGETRLRTEHMPLPFLYPEKLTAAHDLIKKYFGDAATSMIALLDNCPVENRRMYGAALESLVCSGNVNVLASRGEVIIERLHISGMDPVRQLFMGAYAHQLFPEGTNRHDIARIITALAGHAPAGIQVIATHADKLFTKNMEREDVSRIIKALAKHSPENIQLIATHADKLFPEGMRTYEKTKIITALAGHTPENIQLIATHAPQLFSDMSGVYNRIPAIIKALAKHSPEGIKICAMYADELFYDDLSNEYRAQVITALAGHTPENILVIATHIHRLSMGNGISILSFDCDRARIIDALVNHSPTQIVAFSQAIATHVRRLFTKDMNKDDKDLIIYALVNHSPAQIAAFSQAIITHADELFPKGTRYDNGGHDRAEIITALAGHTPENIQVIATYANELFPKGMKTNMKDIVIGALTSHTPAGIQVIATHIHHLFPKGLGNYGNYSVNFTLYSLAKAKYSPAQIAVFSEAIATHADKLFTKNMEREDVSRIIAALAEAKHSPAQIAELAARFTPEMSFNERLKIIS